MSCGEFAQKLLRTPTKPTLPGGRLNKAVVEIAGYLYSRHPGQKCLSETRLQDFQGQERGIDGVGGGTIAGEVIEATVLPG